LYESSGVGNRGKFYDGIGALRDVVQNHLMAMLAYTCMEEPKSMQAEDIRNRRVEVLGEIRIPKPDEISQSVVRGQYGSGEMHCRQCLGYRQEKNVDPNSNTETFVALKLFVDNKRWQGVPIYMRAGKRMIQSVVQIDIQFKPSQSRLFNNINRSGKFIANVLSIRVQPKEGISIHFFAKKPGLSYDLTQVDMLFSYSHSFKKEIDDSYEKLLVDTMLGDQTFFATGKGFQVTWRFVQAILEVWKKESQPKFPNYQAGSWGPDEANTLIRKDGREWLIIPDEKQ
jgi:glucose-6-phosphate 1-dehydrogenase